MTANFTRLLGIMPAALALNALNPSMASAQEGGSGQDKAASTFGPLNFDKKGQLAGVYTGFATSVTERNDEANHSSIPLAIPDKRDKSSCPNDGDVCADISKYAKTYVKDFTDYVDAIKAAKKGSEEAIFRGTPFPIPPKETEENKDTLFSDDVRCYLEIYQAMDEMDGTADGIVHGIALTKLLAKASPERSKLAKKCDVDYFGREDTELSREIYFSTAAPLFAGLTKTAYEGPNSMVDGYVPEEELNETQKKLAEANKELERERKAREGKERDLNNLQSKYDALETLANRYKIGTIAGAGTTALLLGVLIVLGLKSRKNKSNTLEKKAAAPQTVKPPPLPGPAPTATTTPAEEAAKPAATPPPLPATPTPAASAPEPDEFADILEKISQSKGNQTPPQAVAPTAPPPDAPAAAEKTEASAPNT